VHHDRGADGASFGIRAPGSCRCRASVRVGWYSPYWGLYPYGYGYGYGYVPSTGAVKFDTDVKDAEVYIDGAYAGTVGKLKTMNLRPGSYDIEVRSPGRTQFDKKVYVAAGKTLHLNPELHVQAQPQAK